ncbi:MaoC family dehydratase [Effusibacillus dendaii]|uniref:FAS1-like dehydratase domain-containing protein n=1 Tax=Effusibacillus dendaii TaxID=2743772 RepID=A0A7I8DBA7_9BACL|nr:MaoC family dehydratase N-terminal domain-containing protein [Effusibacillus dendaii]BCJ86249.1 hypothetical protein skT53_12340 [Effusibacillus dendaii]
MKSDNRLTIAGGKRYVVVEQIAEYFQTLIGTKNEVYLGQVTSMLIRRYALTVGDENPLYYDKEFAQNHGYPDIIAPPDLLASIVDWGVGETDENLNRDGTHQSEGFLPQSFQGIRIMGGGEEMRFFKPLVAGTHVYLTSEVIDTYSKRGSKGLIAFLSIKNIYRVEKDQILSICTRTMIAR